MQRDLIAGGAAVLLGGVYLAMALQLRPTALADSVGSAGVPKVVGMLMLALGTILLLRTVFAIARGTPQAESGTEPPIGRQLLRAGGLLAIGIAYILIVPHAGYLPAIALLIMAVAAYQGVPLSFTLAGIAVGGALLLWLFFGLLLGIPMPGGAIAHLF